MRTFYFIDEETGEEFLIETTDKKKAIKMAHEYFEDPKFISEISEYEAEMSGLDTYQKGVPNGNYNRSRTFVLCLCPLQSRAY